MYNTYGILWKEEIKLMTFRVIIACKTYMLILLTPVSKAAHEKKIKTIAFYGFGWEPAKVLCLFSALSYHHPIAIRLIDLILLCVTVIDSWYNKLFFNTQVNLQGKASILKSNN